MTVTALEEPISGAAALSFNNVNELTVPTSPRLLQVATWEPIRLKNDFGLALLITLLLNLYVPTT